MYELCKKKHLAPIGTASRKAGCVSNGGESRNRGKRVFRFSSLKITAACLTAKTGRDLPVDAWRNKITVGAVGQLWKMRRAPEKKK